MHCLRGGVRVAMRHLVDQAQMILHGTGSTSMRAIECLHERRARRELGEDIGEHCVAANRGDQHVELGQHTDEPALVVTRGFLLPAMGTETANVVRRSMTRCFAHCFGLDQSPGRIQRLCFLQSGRSDEGAAIGFRAHQACEGEVLQSLTHARTVAAKQAPELLLAKLAAGRQAASGDGVGDGKRDRIVTQPAPDADATRRPPVSISLRRGRNTVGSHGCDRRLPCFDVFDARINPGPASAKRAQMLNCVQSAVLRTIGARDFLEPKAATNPGNSAVARWHANCWTSV